MKRILLIAPVLVLLGSLTAPELNAQSGRGRGNGQGQHDCLRKRDGSCTTPGQGRGKGVRKQDGTGPRGGTADCPKTPKTTKAPAK